MPPGSSGGTPRAIQPVQRLASSSRLRSRGHGAPLASSQPRCASRSACERVLSPRPTTLAPSAPARLHTAPPSAPSSGSSRGRRDVRDRPASGSRHLDRWCVPGNGRHDRRRRRDLDRRTTTASAVAAALDRVGAPRRLEEQPGVGDNPEPVAARGCTNSPRWDESVERAGNHAVGTLSCMNDS